MENFSISSSGLHSMKKLVIVAILFMALGTGLELYLLGHYEDAMQLIPLVSILLVLLTFTILLFRRSKVLMFVYQLLLVVSALSGLVGTFLHLKANVEFESEMKPTADSWTIFVESLSGALPALAPGSMLLFALIGYLYVLLINHNE